MGARFTERAARAAHLARGAHAIVLMAGPAALLTIWLLSALPSALAGTLEVVQERGTLTCGVRDLGPALSALDEQGRWTGFYPEFCHAVAAAAIGDKDAVEFTVVSTADRFDAVREDAVDVLFDSSTWTFARDMRGLAFPTIFLFDGQSFMVRKSLNIDSLAALKGKTVCVTGKGGTTTNVGNLEDVNASQHLGIEIFALVTTRGSMTAFFDRQCDAVTADSLILASLRKSLAPDPEDYAILAELISKEPLGPVVRDDDPAWADVIRWIVFAMVSAEELGVTSVTVDRAREDGSAEAKRLLGAGQDFNVLAGLDRDWAYRVVKQVGNYGEVFDRTLGTTLGLERGLNALWRDGGLLWAPPVR